jgi:hypothetical protein
METSVVEPLEANRLQRRMGPSWIGGGSTESQIKISSDIVFNSPSVGVSQLEVVNLNAARHYHYLAFS